MGQANVQGLGSGNNYFLQTVGEGETNNPGANDENGLARHCDLDC